MSIQFKPMKNKIRNNVIQLDESVIDYLQDCNIITMPNGCRVFHDPYILEEVYNTGHYVRRLSDLRGLSDSALDMIEKAAKYQLKMVEYARNPA